MFQAIYIQTLIHGHEQQGVSERIRSHIQGAEISFFWRGAGLILEHGSSAAL